VKSFINPSLLRTIDDTNFWPYICLVLLLLATNGVPQTHDKPNAHPGPKELGSESGKRFLALQKLLRQAQRGSSVPIRIETYTPDPSNPAAFQGRTQYRTDEIEISVASGVSKSYDEAARSVLGNAHGIMHFPTHLILELWRYADFPVLIW
jgi:hypothetical protein